MLEQVIVPPLFEVHVVWWVARVRAQLVAVPVLAVSPARGGRGRRDGDVDETIDRYEHSGMLVQQNADVAVPQITVELTKEIAEQLVDVPMPQILGISWQSRTSTTGRHA